MVSVRVHSCMRIKINYNEARTLPESLQDSRFISLNRGGFSAKDGGKPLTFSNFLNTGNHAVGRQHIPSPCKSQNLTVRFATDLCD